MRMNDLDEARASFQAVWRVAPTHPNLRENLDALQQHLDYRADQLGWPRTRVLDEVQPTAGTVAASEQAGAAAGAGAAGAAAAPPRRGKKKGSPPPPYPAPLAPSQAGAGAAFVPSASAGPGRGESDGGSCATGGDTCTPDAPSSTPRPPPPPPPPPPTSVQAGTFVPPQIRDDEAQALAQRWFNGWWDDARAQRRIRQALSEHRPVHIAHFLRPAAAVGNPPAAAYDALMMRRARHLLATAPQYCCNNGARSGCTPSYMGRLTTRSSRSPSRRTSSTFWRCISTTRSASASTHWR
jgi:hypothetical protein